MNDRRDFLKAASLLPLVVTESIANAAMPREDATPPGSPVPPSVGKSTRATLPNTAPVAEQAFRNYQLLGQPEADPSANLLGTKRPRDWQTTKDELAAALAATANKDDPIHDWLKTFKLSFDDRATAIVLDAVKTLHRTGKNSELRYEPQLYDASLRSASALLDRCLRYRNEMGGFEVAGISAGINYLAFLKSKPLQRNLIIQTSGADLAWIEQVTQAAAGHTYRSAHGVEKALDRYHLEALQIDAEGSAAEAELARAKDRLRTSLLEKQFHIQIDAQLAQLTRLLSSGSSSNYAERYLRMLALLVEDLADAYRKLYSASKGIQQVLGVSTVSPGTGAPVSADIPAFAAADPLRAWVQLMIPTQDGDIHKPDVLDALVIWTRAVMRQLDTRSQYETEFTVSIPLNQPWGPKNSVILPPSAITTAFSGGNPTGSVTFTLTPDALPYPSALVPHNIRVIGVGLTVEHSQDDASPPQFAKTYPSTPFQSKDPDPSDNQKTAVETFEQVKMSRLNAIVNTPSQSVPDVGSYSRPSIYLTNVRIQGGSGGDLEPTLSYDPGCHNLSPFGSWTIIIDPNILVFFQTASAISDSWITGLVLHLRLRGTTL